MRVHVDADICEEHGQCVFAAPDIFDLGDDGLTYAIQVDDTREPEVLAAQSACPVQAIKLTRVGASGM
ncbi:ferredoxin [Amycolatopsis sp. K13G38]|uniref:Ferredoxin n=1 Tax=Amycolatopsis acididurans TaxID=2724524 RepID=A0ABX1JFP1_9PSEU|nr:ferredoxin [Amycolatopsis acididurans]